MALASPLAQGQEPPKRLSDWILEQPPSPAPYPLGLSWRVPEEVPSQSTLRLELLNSLSGADREVKANSESQARLRDWLRDLPVTGRVPVAVPDPRWLQANPTRDPILLPGHSAVLPQRPRTVTVVMDNGTRCLVPHVQRQEVRAYLAACNSAALRTDWAWIAQPDGRIQRYGVAEWNEESQDLPAPGAWIWGPARDSGWPERFSEKLIRFLATQGPAPDSLKAEVGRQKPEGDGRGVGTATEGLRFRDLVGVREGAEAGEKEIVRPSPPSTAPSRSRGLELTTSDWGNVGLLQTPTARMWSAGHFSFNYSRTEPYSHGNIFAQPFDWLEAGFRYSAISNRPYGPANVAGDQSYKDKGFDFKLRLWPESAYVPQIAVGFRDIAGTGLFSAEYLVASKRTGDLDWSLGVGWGYLAGQPRPQDALTGQLKFGSYFSGNPAPFGGVQWQTPWEKLIVKLEYDGNDYQNEPQGNNQRQSSPLNFGLVYRWGRSTDFTLGVERGNQVSFGLALHTQLDGLTTTKLSDPPRVPVAAIRPQQPPDWSETARELKRQTDWKVRSIEQRGRELRVVLDEAEGVYWRERIDRGAAVLHRDAPANVDRFIFTYYRRGLDVAEHVVDRNTWLAPQLTPMPPANQRETVIARAAQPVEAEEPKTEHYRDAPSRLDTGFGIGYGQTLGGPDAFILYQIYAEERARLRLRDDTWLSGSLRLRLIDNYDKFTFTGPSNLPRVRTFLREYLTTSDLTMPNLQLTHFGKLGNNQYYSVYGGYLEEMFAGVGGEWLYRPFASRLAFGVDLNGVRQRDFHQNFDFLEPSYTTTTGHGTLYWDTGWQDVLAKLSAGRYLAKDSGVTIDFSRVFSNGVVLGAFATKTNVSSQEFGEGSFDKGVYLAFPFDVMMTRTSNSIGHFLWRPLTRDGGAKLWRRDALYDITRLRSDRALKTVPAPAPNDTVIPSERRESWMPEPKVAEPYTRVGARPTARQWRANAAHEYRLVEALYRQEFRNIRVAYDGSNRLTVTLAHSQMHPISRAVGRAARTALNLAPGEAREIRIVFAERTDPVVIYDFFELNRLERYLNGAMSRSEFADYVAVEYLNPAAREEDPLARLADISTDPEPTSIAALVPETRGVGRVMDDIGAAAGTASNVNWLRAGAIGAGIVLTSAALDRRIDRFAKEHAGSSWMKNLTNVGDAIPWLALAGSAVAAFDGSDPVRSRTGYAAAEAGAAALLVSTGFKYAVGRARPNAELGRSTFQPFTGEDRYQSFPSRHVTVAWAVATPFALEYDAKWLYGVAALTNLGRAGSREHWFSDTVAGSVIGYGLGRLFWESSRSRGKDGPRVMIGPRSVNVSWDW